MINLPTIIYGYSKLYCRSGARSGASRKSGGAKRSGERELQKNDGAERGTGGRGAGSRVTEIGWSAERLFRRSRSAHVLWLGIRNDNNEDDKYKDM